MANYFLMIGDVLLTLRHAVVTLSISRYVDPVFSEASRDDFVDLKIYVSSFSKVLREVVYMCVCVYRVSIRIL